MQLHRQAFADLLVSIEQNNNIRTLHFNDGCIQSAIDTQHPGRLPMEGNRAMLSHLLFGHTPQQVLLAGCGGGAIARWFAAMSPDTHGIAVELHAEVARLARDFFDFPAPEHSNWDMQVADIRDYLQQTDKRFDFILVDIEIHQVTPDWITSAAFLDSCRQHLDSDGALTINLQATHAEGFSQALAQIRQQFPGATYCLGSLEHRNIMVTAFRQRPDTSHIQKLSHAASQRWQIDLDHYLQRMLEQNPRHSGVF
ncbi:MAG: methyltransferase domain-containing protein [Chromatiales bacterium]|jgi:spermidine synthase